MKKIEARYTALIKINADVEVTENTLPIDEVKKNWNKMSNVIKEVLMDGFAEDGITIEIEEQLSEVNEVEDVTDQ